MKTFTDNCGRSWELSINITTIRRARSLVGVDLLAYGTDEVNTKLGDLVTFCDVLYALCKDQAVAAGVSDEDFGRGMFGDTLGSAIAAFEDELVDFFQNARLRKNLSELIQIGREVREKSLDVLEQAISTGAIREQAQKLVANLKGSSGDAQAPSE